MDDLEGQMTITGPNASVNSRPADSTDDGSQLNTLDEPVLDTIKRDLAAIGQKFLHVLYPKSSKMLLREWDLWGPLILCLFLAVTLQTSVQSEDGVSQQRGSTPSGPQFTHVFLIYWLGAAVVTLNIKLLGGSISFLQSVCVLGYCVLPLAVGLVLCSVLRAAFSSAGLALFIVRCLIVLGTFVWSTFASTAFLADSQPARRKPLAVYPIFLFYFFIGWLILSQ